MYLAPFPGVPCPIVVHWRYNHHGSLKRDLDHMGPGNWPTEVTKTMKHMSAADAKLLHVQLKSCTEVCVVQRSMTELLPCLGHGQQDRPDLGQDSQGAVN